MLSLPCCSHYAELMRCPLCQCDLPAETAIEGKGSRQCTNCGATLDQYFNETESVALEKIGRFTLLKVLGEGGFGTVYHARDSHLEREVALKTIRLSKLGAAHLEARLVREAKAASKLNHAGIVKVFELVDVASMKVLVEEYVEGDTLDSLIKRKKLTQKQSVEIAIKVAEALDVAHQEKVIHRDIKPANIILDAYGQPRILDFGLAKREGLDESMTEEGQLIGTIIYMSPEQANGQIELIGQASDQYSLAICLFQMLTDELPFRGAGNVILRAIVRDDAPSLRSLKDSIPRDLENICLKALSKKISDRYSSCGAFAADLRRYLKSEPVEARPVGVVGKLERWARRNRTLAVSLATIAIILLLATGISSYFAVKSMSDLQGRISAEQRLLLEGDASEIRPVIQSFRANLSQHEADLQILRVKYENDPRRLARVLMTLNEKDPELEKELFELMQKLAPADALLVHEHLQQKPSSAMLDAEWQTLANQQSTPARRLLAAVTLSKAVPQDGRWPLVSKNIVHTLLDPLTTIHLPLMLPYLKPVYPQLKEAWQAECWNQKDKQRATLACTVFLQLYGSDIRSVVRLLSGLPVNDMPRVIDHLKLMQPREQVIAELKRVTSEVAHRDALIRIPINAPKVPEQVMQQVQAAGGFVQESFAICAALSWSELEPLLKEMTFLGYRPINCRPYSTANGLKVGIIWHRDHAPGQPPYWKMAVDMDAATLQQNNSNEWKPTELAAYEIEPKPGLRETRFVWIAIPEKSKTPPRMQLLLPEAVYAAENRSWLQARSGLPFSTGILDTSGVQLPVLCAPLGVTGNQSFSQVFATAPSQRGHESYLTSFSYALPEGSFRRSLTDFQIHHELRWVMSTPAQTRREYFQSFADSLFKAYELNETQSLDLEQLIPGKTLTERELSYLILLCARQGNAVWVKHCLDQYQTISFDRRWPLFLASASAILLQKQNALFAELARFEKAVANYDDGFTRLLRARLLGIAAEVDPDPNQRLKHIGQALNLAEQSLREGGGLTDAVENWWSRDLSLLADKLEPWIQRERDKLRFAACWSPARLLEQQVHYGETIDLAVSLWQRWNDAGYVPHSVSIIEWEGKPRVVSAWRRARPTTTDERRMAIQHAQAILALALLGEPDPLWKSLQDGSTENLPVSLANEILMRARECGIPLNILGKQLTTASNSLFRYRLLLLLGQYSLNDADDNGRDILPTLTTWFIHDPDPGVHAACDWLLRKWNQHDTLQSSWKSLDASLANRGNRRWYRSATGMDYVVFENPRPFYMGHSVDDTDMGTPALERPHLRKVGHSFALGSRKVTSKQYIQFDERHRTGDVRFAPSEECPVGNIRWNRAAEFCNWLSKQEGIPQQEWCYVLKPGTRLMQPVDDYLMRTGYRLPTEAELEYALRGNSRLIRFHGNHAEGLELYAWYRDTASRQMHPVGLLRPHPQGLFDAQGNAYEWTNDKVQLYPAVFGNEIIHDECWHLCAARHTTADSTIALRGFTWGGESYFLRLSQRHSRSDTNPSEGSDIGIRLARTINP